jgi:hypothetical protein
VRDGATHQRDGAALAEGVDAVARDALDFKGEVDLVLLGELLQLDGVVQQLVQRVFGVLATERRGAGGGAELAVHAKERRRVELQMQI